MNNKLGAGEKTLENISRFSQKDSIVVIGGQQPGLLTGSSYIIYKIITVLRLSSFIQEKTGTKTIPCFWNASDDSSLDQSNNLGLLTDEYKKIKIDTSKIAEGTRLSNIFLPDSYYHDLIEEFTSLLSGAGQDEGAGRFLRETLDDWKKIRQIKGNIGLAELFSFIILKLFSRWGPVIIDPSHAGFKKMGLSFLGWDIDEHTSINKSIKGRGLKLKEAGYHAQLVPNEDALDFFMNNREIREKVEVLPGKIYKTKDRNHEKESLLEEAEKDPSSVSWNVVLRPLVQDTLFPVAAAVCGPGEVSYFSQMGGVYDHKGIRMPVIYPRFSATLVEDPISGSMKRSGVEARHLEKAEDETLKTVLKEDETSKIEGIIDGLGKEIRGRIERVEDELKDSGLDTGSSFDRIKRNLSREVEVLLKKIYSALKKKNQPLIKNIRKIYLNLLPDGGLQERKINIFYYLNKYGIDMISSLYKAYVPLEHGHRFIYLKGDKKDERKK